MATNLWEKLVFLPHPCLTPRYCFRKVSILSSLSCVLKKGGRVSFVGYHLLPSWGGSSTRGKFTCLQRHPVTLIGGKSWKCFAFWVNLDRWKSPFAFWLFVAHWFSQWTNGPIGPADYSRWWTGYLSNQSCVTTDSWTAPGKWFLWWGVDWAMKDQATSPFGHRKSILVEAKQALKNACNLTCSNRQNMVKPSLPC